MKIVSVVGARPQFIKAAMVSLALARLPRPPIEVLVHTGQHYDHELSQIFFDELGLRPPDFNLGIGSAGQGTQTGRMLEAVEEVLLRERPAVVVVYGDTNSTLAGALAAAKLGIPVAHVEAGLRSYNRAMPEEINRIMTDHLSSRLFCPTAQSEANLRREGFPAARPGPLPPGPEPMLQMCGDVMYDAALHFTALARERFGRRDLPPLYALATVHRAENTDDPVRLRDIIEGLVLSAGLLPILLPLHPRTKAGLDRHGLGLPKAEGLTIMNPVGYLEMLRLEAQARLVITDSGGVQKEAFFQGVPCLTLRRETEWVELVEMGFNRLVDADPQAILQGVRACLAQPLPSRPALTPYGDGQSADRIAASLVNMG